MTFLNPAVLIGLLAAAIPVLIHLLNLRKVERVEFSTLAFLKELQKSKIRKIKFKQWLLLALRILIVVSIVLAFARPALKTKSFLNSTSSAKTTGVLLLDDTPSMQLLSDNGTNFNLMKKTAKDILKNFSSGDEIFILKFSDSAPVKFFSIEKATKYIEALSVSSLAGNFERTIKTAYEILQNSQNVNKEIYLLSDFQRNLFAQGRDKNKAGFSSGVVYWKRLKMPVVNNFSISGFNLENRILQVGKEVGFSASVKFNGTTSAENTALYLFLNGKKEAQVSLGGSSQNKRFTATLSKAGLISAVCELSEDAFEYDNKNYLCFYVPGKINTVLIRSTKSETKFLRLALNSNVNKLVSFKEIAGLRFNSLNLLNYNVAVIVGYSPELNFKKIINFLNSGGGVILIPAGNSTTVELNKIANSLNLPPFGEFVRSKNFANINSFGRIDFSHPLFEGMFTSGEKPKIESPEFYGYLKFKTGGKGIPVIKLEDGSDFLSEFEIGKGKVLVFNTPFDLRSTDLPLKGFFAPLINRALFYLSSNVGSIKTVEAGKPVEVKLSAAVIPQLTVKRPDGSKEVIDLRNRKKNYFNYTKTNLTGVYKFYSGNKLIDYAAVNPVKSESELESLSDKEVQKILSGSFPSADLKQIKENSNLKELILRSRFGTELWKYFLFFTLILAIVEMLVGKSSKKDLVDLKNVQND